MSLAGPPMSIMWNLVYSYKVKVCIECDVLDESKSRTSFESHSHE